MKASWKNCSTRLSYLGAHPAGPEQCLLHQALEASIITKIRNHCFWAMGIMVYLKNGSTLDEAEKIGL